MFQGNITNGLHPPGGGSAPQLQNVAELDYCKNCQRDGGENGKGHHRCHSWTNGILERAGAVGSDLSSCCLKGLGCSKQFAITSNYFSLSEP